MQWNFLLEQNQFTESIMKIRNIYEKTIPIASQIRNAVITFSEMTISVIVIETDVIKNGKSLIGYGFNSNGRYAQAGILNERIIPRLLKAKPESLLNEEKTNFDPFECWNVMMTNEKPGGHGERSVAVGAVDMAIWDLVTKIEEKPLYIYLGEKFGKGSYKNEVYVYAAGGYYYPGKNLKGLQDELKKYLDMGFTDCKMKIGGVGIDEDLKRIEAALVVTGRGEALAVDANGKYELSAAVECAEAISPYHLKWYEEPGDPLDFELNAAVADISDTPIATGENLFSLSDARNLLRYGGLFPRRDYIQIDPVLSYGLTEYLRILNMMSYFAWKPDRCIPHGGHLFGIHIAAGLSLHGNEAYPGVFEPFGKFAEGMELRDGKVNLPDVSGIGYESIPEVYNVLKKIK